MAQILLAWAGSLYKESLSLGTLPSLGGHALISLTLRAAALTRNTMSLFMARTYICTCLVCFPCDHLLLLTGTVSRSPEALQDVLN